MKEQEIFEKLKEALEYKVVDSVKIDSIVVFKDSIYGK